MVRALLLVLCIASLPAAGQDGPPPTPPPAAADLPPPPPPPPTYDCQPACRSGFQCIEGTCRPPECSPPCADGQQCLEGGSCGSALSAPPGSLINDAGEHAPPGHHYEVRRRKGMLITGISLFAGGWIGGAAFAVDRYSESKSGAEFASFVPLAGSLISRVLAANNRADQLGWFTHAFFATIFTGLQVVGAVLAVFGFPARQMLVPDDDYRTPEERRDSKKLPPIQWSLSPGAPGAPLGISLLIEN